MNYETNPKYIKIKKYSETIERVSLTAKQKNLIETLILEINETDTKMKQLVNINKRIFLIPLLMLEGESSSLIEGTRSQYEDFAYDYEELNNIPQWETRNLLNIYDKYLLNDYYNETFTFSKDSVRQMHIDLFAIDKKSKFELIIDPMPRIKQVKPGRIMDNDEKPNFIGNSNKIEEANLILLKPSLKNEFMTDMFNTIQNKIDNKELLVDDIVLMHPIFEAIHPFRDGNGRIGRLLLSLLFSKKFNKISLPIYISEQFNEREEEYKQKLFNVQNLDSWDAWNEWISFFIDCLIDTKRNLVNRIEQIKQRRVKLMGTKAVSTEARRFIVENFFEHYKVNKKILIKRLQIKFKNTSLTSIYKDFKIVANELGVAELSEGYYAFEDIKNIIRSKKNLHSS